MSEFSIAVQNTYSTFNTAAAGARVDQAMNDGWSPLFRVAAAYNNKASVVAELLQCGADPSTPTKDIHGVPRGVTALSIAQLRGYYDVVAGKTRIAPSKESLLNALICSIEVGDTSEQVVTLHTGTCKPISWRIDSIYYYADGARRCTLNSCAICNAARDPNSRALPYHAHAAGISMALRLLRLWAGSIPLTLVS